MPPIRFGVLGAARIAPSALLRPARHVAGVEVVVVAARDHDKASAFAATHHIPRVARSYEELVGDPDIDAVYNPLPNGLHGRWTMAALAAGKHVLCEKPFTANAAEARAVAGAVPPGVIVMEAFHYRYHPVFMRARQLLDEGAVGAVHKIETWLCFPLPRFNDIRYQLDLAGGATMDAGCYAIHMARHLAGSEPEVVAARAALRSPGVDRAMQADLRFDSGVTGQVTCSMWSRRLLHIGFRVSGDAGDLRVFNPVGPNLYHRLSVRGRGGRRVEHLSRRPTYEFQLEAFCAAVAGGAPPITGVTDAIANMEVIDAVYRHAGLEPGARLLEPRLVAHGLFPQHHLDLRLRAAHVTESLKFIGLVALLFLGAGGWGTAAVVVLHRLGWERAREEIGPALQLVLGVSLFLAVGGVLVASDLARFDVLVAWHVIGLVLLLSRVGVVARHLRALNLRAVLFGVAAAAVGVVLALISLGIAIGTPFYNVFDDDASYIYLAKRLLSTGGLVDPFNARRMTSYGGATLYQSFFLHSFGNSSLRGFEFTFASLLLVIVTVGTTRRKWLALGTLVLGLGIFLGHGIGPVQNLSPTLSAAALSLGAYQLLAKVRSSSQADQPWLYAVIGVVLGGILALRFYYLISVVIAAIIAIIVTRGTRSVRPIIVIACFGIASVSGWAVALYRSSKTPLFPLLEGNYNPSYPVGPNPFASGVGSYTHQIWGVLNGYDVGWLILACIALSLGALTTRRGDRQLFVVLLAAGIGCLAQMFIFTVIFSGFAAIEIDRFEAPSTLACGLLAVYALWPRRDPDAPWPPAVNPRSGSRGAGAVPWRALAPGALTLVLLLGIATLTFGGTLGVVWRSSTTHVRLGFQVLRGTTGFADRYTGFRTEYNHLNAAIPTGAKVLAAVDYPTLLSFSRYDFATLDLVGSVSPPPRMPYFEGATAKVSYLRHLGYDYIVADSEAQRGLYQFGPWEADLHSPRYNYRAWAPYFLDWMSTVTSLEHDDSYHVRYFGSLALIEIRRP